MADEPDSARPRNTDDLFEASEAKYRDLAESFSDPFTAYDTNLRLIYRNKAAADATQIPDEQAIGKTFGEIHPDLVGSKIHQAYLRALETHQPQRHFSRWVRPADGAEFYFDFSVYPTSDGVIIFSRDVTEGKRAEKALQKSEEKFSRAFRSNPVAQTILRASDRRIIDVNETFLEQTDLTREEAIGHTAIELGLFLNPSDRVKLAFTGNQGPIRNQEIKVRTKRGVIRTQLISTEPIEIDGEACLLMTGIDITERVQTEEALNERNAAIERGHIELINERNRILAVMEALPVGIAIYDRDGGVIQHNKDYEAIWGSPPPPAASGDDYETYPAWWVETGQRVQPEEWASARAVKHGETVTGQFLQIRRLDGTRATVLNSGAPTRDANGRVTGCVVAIMDVTRMVETEDALRESQDRFHVAVDALPIMVYTCDRELHYTWIYRPLRGYHPEEILGKRDDEILTPEAAAELTMVKQRAVDSGQGGAQEVRVPLQGEYTYYLLTTEPVRDKQGYVTGLICSAIDITKQKQLEMEQQEQAIQIEVQRRLMDQREQDRYAIARDLHDGPIQTLASSIFHLQMVKEVFPDPALETELCQVRLDIKNAIQELRGVLNELRPPALMHFGFSKVLRQNAEDIRERFPNIEIELDVDTDEKTLSKQAQLALFRIYQAGINNIIRHSQASRVWVVYHVEPDHFEFELRDNGKGFEVMKDYAQLVREGHFGLVGMKERAEAIGGEFSVSSARGQGTKITVSGPLTH